MSGVPKEVATVDLAIGAQDLNGDTLPASTWPTTWPGRLDDDCSAEKPEVPQERALPARGPDLVRLMHGERHFLKPGSKTIGTDSFKGMGDIHGHQRRRLPDIYVSNLTDTGRFRKPFRVPERTAGRSTAT